MVSLLLLPLELLLCSDQRVLEPDSRDVLVLRLRPSFNEEVAVATLGRRLRPLDEILTIVSFRKLLHPDAGRSLPLARELAIRQDRPLLPLEHPELVLLVANYNRGPMVDVNATLAD